MISNDSDDRREIPAETIAERLDSVSEGDELRFNDRDEPLEVVAVDRYSITVSGDDGAELTISQNLQSGEWNVHQPVWWVDTVDETE